MADFSTSTRLLATLLLLAISYAAWQWLRTPTPTSRALTSADQRGGKKSNKKRNAKKKNANKKAAEAADAADEAHGDTGIVAQEAVAATPAVPRAAVDAASESDESDDSDVGRSARHVLSTKRFAPKAIGGARGKSNNATAPSASAVKFQLHQRVLARFQGGSDWFAGVVTEVRRGNEYHILYDDGEVEFNVPHTRIKDAAAGAASGTSTTRGKRSTSDEKLPRGAGLDSARSEADDEAEPGGHDVGDSSDDVEESHDDDGWQVVSSTKSRPTGSRSSATAAAPEENLIGGLTKRQREARRKKERQREVKEMARAQAQENGLHARWGGTMSKMKYVPPPPQAPK